MATIIPTRDVLLALAQNIFDTDSRGGLLKRGDLQALLSSLQNAARSVIAARNEFSIIRKLPPGTLLAIFKFIAEPRTRESAFELVKMTHVCQHWRTMLLSHPHLWSSIFVKNDRKEFVAACLERSRDVPLTVSIDLKYGNYRNYREFPECTCYQWMTFRKVTDANTCRYHTTILPLLDPDYTGRIRKLDVRLTLMENLEESAGDTLASALDDLRFFGFPLPSLEHLSFSVDSNSEADGSTHLEIMGDLFDWGEAPPTKLRHLTLHGCYGGLVLSIKNLTSFELVGVKDWSWQPIALDKRTFRSFISGSPALVSLCLTHCGFPNPSKLSKVTPVELPQLKTLRLTDVRGPSSFPRLLKIPALKTLSSLHISTRKRGEGPRYDIDFRVQAQSDDGFRLSFDILDFSNNEEDNDRWVSDWLTVMHNAGSCPGFVRLGGSDLDPEADHDDLNVSPLPLIANAKVLEVDASSIGRWYPNFWEDLEKIDPQLTTLRLGVTQGTEQVVAKSVKKFVKTRSNRGVSLGKLERMSFEGMGEEDEAKAKTLWEKFRACLGIDRYLADQYIVAHQP